MTKRWADYIDQFGLVTQKQSLGGDGGDSLNRTCATEILCHLSGVNQPKLAQPFLLADNRLRRYRRSLHASKWYADFDRTSRDQLIPLVIWLGLFKKKRALRAVFFDHLRRGLLFAYNTRRNFQYATPEETAAKNPPGGGVVWNYGWKIPDLTGPEFWALYIRGFASYWLFPLLYLFDIFPMLGAIVIRFKTREDDVINHALTLEYARVRQDTFWMKLARVITPRVLLQQRLDQFFGKEIEPPINDLYRQL